MCSLFSSASLSFGRRARNSTTTVEQDVETLLLSGSQGKCKICTAGRLAGCLPRRGRFALLEPLVLHAGLLCRNHSCIHHIIRALSPNSRLLPRRPRGMAKILTNADTHCRRARRGLMDFELRLGERLFLKFPDIYGFNAL